MSGNYNVRANEEVPIFAMEDDANAPPPSYDEEMEIMASHSLSINTAMIPPTFSGSSSEDVQEWLDNFSTMAKANGWTNAAKYFDHLPVFLGGTAKDWYKATYKDGVPDSIADFKDDMLSTFSYVKPALMNYSAMIERTQQLNENVSDYFWQKLKLINRVDADMTDVAKIQLIMKGLTPLYLNKVYARDFVTITSFAKTLRLIHETMQMSNNRPEAKAFAAEMFEQIFAVDRPPTRPTQQPFNRTQQSSESRFNPPSDVGPPRPQVDQQPWRQPQQSTFQGRSAGQPTETRTCFNCDRVGHLSRDCRAPRKPRNGFQQQGGQQPRQQWNQTREDPKNYNRGPANPDRR